MPYTECNERREMRKSPMKSKNMRKFIETSCHEALETQNFVFETERNVMECVLLAIKITPLK